MHTLFKLLHLDIIAIPSIICFAVLCWVWS